MNIRSSKLKVQSSKEAPMEKDQFPMGDGSGDAWLLELEDSELLVLRDEGPKANGQHPWNLEERLSVFGEQIVRFSKKIPRDPTNNRLIDQIVGAATSAGANYCEANESVSKRDFKDRKSVV